jgi:hypothetical protein
MDSKMKLSLLLLALFALGLHGEEPVRDWLTAEGKQFKGRLLDYGLKNNPETNLSVPMATLEIHTTKRTPDGEVPTTNTQDVPMEKLGESSREEILDWDWLRKKSSHFARCLRTAYGDVREIQLQRRQEGQLYDKIYRHDGGITRGIVQNQSFNMHTTYGNFVIRVQALAAAQFTGVNGSLAKVISVNSNRLSGYLDIPEDSSSGGQAGKLVFITETGQKETLRQELVSRIVFHVRDDEFVPIDAQRRASGRSVYVLMKNGDYFDAKVAGGVFPLNANGRQVDIPASEVSRVEVAGKGRPQTKVIKTSGGSEIGFFSAEELQIQMDAGPSLQVYRDKLDLVYCQDGFRPQGKILQLQDSREARLSIDASPDGKPWGIIDRISSNSPFAGILADGDKLVSVNLQVPDFSSKDNSYEMAVKALFENKSIPYIILGVERAGDFFEVTLSSGS